MSKPKRPITSEPMKQKNRDIVQPVAALTPLACSLPETCPHCGAEMFDYYREATNLKEFECHTRWFRGSVAQGESPITKREMNCYEREIAQLKEALKVPIASRELWDLRQHILNLGMGDPWDGEELENGYVRPIPKGFEDEVAKFDAAYSQQIKDINATLDIVSDMATRQARWENLPLTHGGPANE